VQRAVEVHDRTLEEAELEELVRARAEASLDRARDLLVLGGADGEVLGEDEDERFVIRRVEKPA
jgi:predicted membrane-bound spermidine synthase